MKVITIFTDGACQGNQNSVNIGGWGAVLNYQDHTKELYGGEINTTNNRMELKAVIEGLKALKTTHIPVKIYSDSAYTVNCFKEGWHIGWVKNGWKNSQKKPVENQDLWVELLALVGSQSKVSFLKLKGHLDSASKAEINKWKAKMETSNGETYTDEEFANLTKMNILADALANKGADLAKEQAKI